MLSISIPRWKGCHVNHPLCLDQAYPTHSTLWYRLLATKLKTDMIYPSESFFKFNGVPMCQHKPFEDSGCCGRPVPPFCKQLSAEGLHSSSEHNTDNIFDIIECSLAKPARLRGGFLGDCCLLWLSQRKRTSCKYVQPCRRTLNSHS